MQTDIHFWSYLAQFFLQWEMFQTKVVQKIKTHILCSVTFLENRAVYEIMWENIVERGREQMTTWRMRIACWIPEVTDTHSDYVILIAFPFYLHAVSSFSCIPVICPKLVLFLTPLQHNSPTGRRNHGRPLKRLLDAWDRNGSTSGPTAWQAVAYPGILFGGLGSTNSVEDRGQRERGSGGGSPLVGGSGGSCCNWYKKFHFI